MTDKIKKNSAPGFTTRSFEAWWQFTKVALLAGVVLGWLIVTLVFISVGFSGGLKLYAQFLSLGVVAGGAFLTLLRTLEWVGLPDSYFETTADFHDYMSKRNEELAKLHLDNDDNEDDVDFDP